MTNRVRKGNLVLLVEDDLAHAELIIRSLEAYRSAEQIVHLQDGETAMRYLRHTGEFADAESAPRPDVILLDLRLPRLDGLEVLRIIKDDPALCTIPVVMLTTSKAEEDITRAYAHHVNSYLVKPVSFERFQALMKDLGLYWLDWNERVDGET